MPKQPTVPDRPPLQFYASVLDIAALPAAQAAVTSALSEPVPAAILLGFTSEDPVIVGDMVTALQPPIQAAETACILLGDPALAVALGCDGAHLEFTDMPVKQARSTLGDDHILGIGCNYSRHDAMIAAEQGADYVAFGPYTATSDAEDLSALTWWQEMMETPCVAITDDAGLSQSLYDTGADFVLVHKTA